MKPENFSHGETDVVDKCDTIASTKVDSAHPLKGDSSTATNDPPAVVQVSSSIYHLWCLPVVFNGETVNYFLDSGAMVTVMRKDVYDLLSADDYPLTTFPGVVRGISSSPTKVYGQCLIPYTIDGIAYKALTIVADIGPTVLLGLNFLIDNKAVVDYELGQLKLNGKEYILKTRSEQRSRTLALVSNVTIAPLSETSVELKTKSNNGRISSCVIVSPLRNITGRTGIVMGHTLSKPIGSRTVLANIVNPTDLPITLEEGTDLGLAVPADLVMPVECPTSSSNETDLPEHVM